MASKAETFRTKKSTRKVNWLKIVKFAIFRNLLNFVKSTTRSGLQCLLTRQRTAKNPRKSPARKIRGTQRRFPPKFIGNTFQAIQSAFRYLEMHSKRRYKICICSVILGELESFRNYKGLSIIFPKILDEFWPITKVKHFLILNVTTVLNPKILGSLFSEKNSLTWEVKCEN